jgi:hypothetical protein
MVLALLLAALAAPQKAVPDDPALAAALRGLPAAAAVLEHAEEHRVQVLLASVGADAKGRPVLVRRGLRVDREYVYPASAIKLCAAVAALETLNALRRKEPRLTEDTPLAFHPLFAGEELEQKDPSNLEGGTITLRHEIRKLFLVSDNAAFNRLYELVGQQELAERLERAGLKRARVVHRLSEARSEEENRRAPAVDFLLDGDARFTLPERTSRLRIEDLRVPGVKVGAARVEGDRRVEGPMSFARKNSISLVELQDALAKLVRPDLALDGEPYGLTDAQRELLLQAASEYPSASGNPRYPKDQYPDSWGKFLLPGLERVAPKDAWRIANKIGRAYGFSIENAWVLHVPSGRGLFVTAAVYTNANGVLNDGIYEYEQTADPFLAALGELVGRELAR